MPALSMPAKLLCTLFEHKAWANQELLQILISNADDADNKNWRLATRLMNHLYVVDRIFMGHLTGFAHGYQGTNTPETPALADLLAQTTQSDQELLAFITKTSAQDFDKIIDFTFTDGKAGSMSVAEILMHLITHGSYHRGMIGRILSEEKVSAPRDILTGFLHLNRDTHAQ